MMKITTVLFDLDGTLLPMDQNLFIKSYFAALSDELVKYGYSPDSLTGAIWQGMTAMVKNNGEKTNEEVFWDKFADLLGERVRGDYEIFERFYRDSFDTVRGSCGYNENADRVVKRVKSRGMSAVLATNPVFPSIATEHRIRWAGLDLSDFKYVSTYENSRYTKPNLDYYREILEKIHTSPDECLMVGNDVTEDLVAQALGMKVFLLTDNLINKSNADVSAYTHGSFGELFDYIDSL